MGRKCVDIRAGDESVRINGCRVIRVSSEDESAHLFVETEGGEKVNILIAHLFGFFFSFTHHGNRAGGRYHWGRHSITLPIMDRKVVFSLLTDERGNSRVLPGLQRGVLFLVIALLLLFSTLCVPTSRAPINDTGPASILPITEEGEPARPEIASISALLIRDQIIRGEIWKAGGNPSIIPLLTRKRTLARNRGHISLYRKFSTFLFLIHKKRRVKSPTNP